MPGARNRRNRIQHPLGTIIVKDGLIHVPVGGSVVADSDPVVEYEETLVKSQAMFAALDFRLPR